MPITAISEHVRPLLEPLFNALAAGTFLDIATLGDIRHALEDFEHAMQDLQPLRPGLRHFPYLR